MGDPAILDALRALQDQVKFPLAALDDTDGFRVGIVHLDGPPLNPGVTAIFGDAARRPRPAFSFMQANGGFGWVASQPGATCDSFLVRDGRGLGTITTWFRAPDQTTLRKLLWQEHSLTYLITGLDVPADRLIVIANSLAYLTAPPPKFPWLP